MILFILEHIIQYQVNISEIELMVIGQLINPSISTYELWPQNLKSGIDI